MRACMHAYVRANVHARVRVRVGIRAIACACMRMPAAVYYKQNVYIRDRGAHRDAYNHALDRGLA